MNEIPSACLHGDCGYVSPLADCHYCNGTGRVEYYSDEYPPGTNSCCCTCKRCREKHATTNTPGL